MNKRASISLAFICILAVSTLAQDTIKTLFHPKKLTAFGIYLAPEYQFGQVAGSNASLLSNAIMVQFNNRFAIGFSSTQLMQPNFSPKLVSPLYLQANYTGLKMEYTFLPKSAIHFNVSLLGGLANASADSNASFFGFQRQRFTGDSGAFIGGRRNQGMHSQYAFVQPALNIEANLLKCLKVYAGASYRFGTPLADNNQLDKTAINGFSINAGIKVGVFNVAPDKLKHKPRKSKRAKEKTN